MRYLSSSSTFIPKYVFPFLWVALMAGLAITALFDGRAKADSSAVYIPVALAVLVLLLRHFLDSALADQVVDLGDHLVVKRGLLTDRIPLASIVEVSETVAVNPPAITLRLSAPSKFGRLISFVPVSSSRLNPLAEHSLVSELRERAASSSVARAG